MVSLAPQGAKGDAGDAEETAGFCTPSITVVTDCGKHTLDQAHGGHVGTSHDAGAVWAGVMWASPNVCDVKYKLSYSDDVTLTGLTAKYDAGATVKLLSSTHAELGSTGCYATSKWAVLAPWAP